MRRRRVKSSNLKSIGWQADSDDPETGTLEVEFHGRRIYRYTGVEKVKYDEMLAINLRGGSVGKYFIAEIRDQDYEYERVQ